ncbi:MAG: DUF1993 domain-containing protein [Rhodospirillaceae bacterium]
MSTTLDQIAVPLFSQTLAAQAAEIDIAIDHCTENNVDSAPILESRLAPDMFTYTQQIQRATFHACQAMAKMADIDVPEFADDETSFEDLKALVKTARDFVRGVDVSRLAGREEAAIQVQTRVALLEFTCRDFLLHFAIPQVLFHSTTAHGLLRSAGIDVGKRHFLGSADDR